MGTLLGSTSRLTMVVLACTTAVVHRPGDCQLGRVPCGSGTLRHEVVTRFSKALRDAKGICTVTWATIPSPRVATRAVRSRPPPFRRDRAGPVPERDERSQSSAV